MTTDPKQQLVQAQKPLTMSAERMNQLRAASISNGQLRDAMYELDATRAVLAEKEEQLKKERGWEQRFDSLSKEVYEQAGPGDYHHPWDAIGGIEKRLADLERTQQVNAKLRKELEHAILCLDRSCRTCRNMALALVLTEKATK